MERKAFYLKPVACLCCLLICSFCIAQSKFSFGVKAGISIPNLQSPGSNPVSDGYSSRFGPNFGIVSEIELSKKFSLETELNYSSQGWKEKWIAGDTCGRICSIFSTRNPA